MAATVDHLHRVRAADVFDVLDIGSLSFVRSPTPTAT